MDEEDNPPIEDNEYLRWIFDQGPIPDEDAQATEHRGTEGK